MKKILKNNGSRFVPATGNPDQITIGCVYRGKEINNHASAAKAWLGRSLKMRPENLHFREASQVKRGMQVHHRFARQLVAFMQRMTAQACALVLLGGVIGGLGLLPSSAQANATVGAWGPLRVLPWRPVHSVMLPTGKVLFFQSEDGPLLWDPVKDLLSNAPPFGYNPLCAGHSLLANGKVLITSGHIDDFQGESFTRLYNPFTNQLELVPDMNGGRWYPGQVTLSNGDVVVMSGEKADGTRNLIPQVYQARTNTWRDLTTASQELPLYPSAFLASSGKVFVATSLSHYLDTSGTGSWTNVAQQKTKGRDNYGACAMYEPDKVICAGGGKPPTATVEQISLSSGTPAWKYVSPMPQGRRQHTMTILADGTLLVTSGSYLDGFNTEDGPHPALLYNWKTDTWTTLATPQEYRGYHSEAVLLRNGSVAVIGGNDHPSLEIFKPPYLFKGPRPKITSAPAKVGYGETFFVGTSDTIATVNMVRLSASSHTENMNQRINKNLTFTPATGGLNITAPASARRCPPGHYMLFLLNSKGVPSVARIIRIL